MVEKVVCLLYLGVAEAYSGTADGGADEYSAD